MLASWYSGLAALHATSITEQLQQQGNARNARRSSHDRISSRVTSGSGIIICALQRLITRACSRSCGLRVMPAPAASLLPVTLLLSAAANNPASPAGWLQGVAVELNTCASCCDVCVLLLLCAD